MEGGPAFSMAGETFLLPHLGDPGFGNAAVSLGQWLSAWLQLSLKAADAHMEVTRGPSKQPLSRVS